MRLPLSSCVYVAAMLLTGSVSIVSAHQPGPAVKTPPLLKNLPPADPPSMTDIPKSYLVSGLLSKGGQVLFTGPNGGIVLGPIHTTVVPCSTMVTTISADKPHAHR